MPRGGRALGAGGEQANVLEPDGILPCAEAGLASATLAMPNRSRCAKEASCVAREWRHHSLHQQWNCGLRKLPKANGSCR